MTKLERSWKNCLRMWKWIAEVYGTAGYKFRSVYSLKEDWLKKNRFTREIDHDCFFCDYAGGQGDTKRNGFKTGCPNCPGRLVCKRFECTRATYTFVRKPKAFYKKLCQLAKKGGYERFI